MKDSSASKFDFVLQTILKLCIEIVIFGMLPYSRYTVLVEPVLVISLVRHLDSGSSGTRPTEIEIF